MAYSKSIDKLINTKAETDITPIIDVTFLLLIFFMCTLHFKTLEGSLQAYMPDNGSNTIIEKSKNPIHIKLYKATQDSIVIWIDDTPFEGNDKYHLLFQKIKNIIDLDKSLDADISVIIDPDINVPFQDLISTLNVCRKVDELRPNAKPLKVSFTLKEDTKE